MTAAGEILSCQRQLALVLERMLALAREGQWKRLPVLDAECAALAARLRELELPDRRDEDNAAIAALFSRIADGQAELNALVRPQFIELMRRIGEQRRPHDRMRARKPTHDPEKCPPGGARSSAGDRPH